MKNSKLKLAKNSNVRAIALISLFLFCTGIVLAQIESFETRYKRALKIFYEARRHQSLGASVKALQKYEEAYCIFQEVSIDQQGSWPSQARKKMKEILKDVQRLETTFREELGLTSSPVNHYTPDSHETLRRFQRWYKQARKKSAPQTSTELE